MITPPQRAGAKQPHQTPINKYIRVCFNHLLKTNQGDGMKNISPESKPRDAK